MDHGATWPIYVRLYEDLRHVLDAKASNEAKEAVKSVMDLINAACEAVDNNQPASFAEAIQRAYDKLRGELPLTSTDD